MILNMEIHLCPIMKNIPDNTKVMGYPAKNIREFLRENK